jgi:hypothetical protein
MRAVWVVLVAGFRRQWRSWLLLSLLIAVATGFVLASAAAGRRTDSAFPRYVASHGYDAIVYTVQPMPKLPQDVVAQVVPVQMPFYGQPGCSCHRTINNGAFSVREIPPASLGRVAKLVAGRMPDPSSPVEALASFTLQRDYGVHLGTVITLPMAAASQRKAVFDALAGGPIPKPAGPRMAMRVVGIVAAENEFSAGQGVTYDLYPGPGFAVATKGSPALTSYYVRLRHGQADFARFEAFTSRLEGTGVQDLDRPAATITNSIHPQAVGWQVLAALAAVAVVGQALARQASAESADHPVLAVLGLSSRQLAARIMLRTLAVAVAGAAGGIALATLLSPLAPLGEARLADPAPGLSFDAPVFGLGALATAIVFWQATTVAVVAIAAGIPLGIAAGRAIWRAFAISLGVVPVPVVQAWLIVALAAGALIAAIALAAVPAMSAARSRPGQLLRTE